MPAWLISRWRTGTLAAAGTIPVTAVNAYATLARSKGHHPAKRRPAIPTRGYDSGSGGSRHAAPVHHPHPSRPPPATAQPGTPTPGRRLSRSRRPASRAPAASLRERSAPHDPGHRSPGTAAIRAWAQPGTPSAPAQPPGHTPSNTHKTDSNQAQDLQRLDTPGGAPDLPD